MPAVATMDLPGSADDPGSRGHPGDRAGLPGRRRPLGLLRRPFAVDVGHAQAAAHHQLGQVERGEEAAQHLGRLLEMGHVEDLAADVGVHADQLDPGQQLEGGHRLGGGAGRHREAELGVLLPGAHELVGVDLDSRGDPHQHRGGARLPGSSVSRPSRAISSKESTTIRPTPAASARASSASDLLLPCSTSRSAGTPAASATCSSPPVDTSRYMPSWWASAAIAVHRKALVA